jgi:hypothetical protein
MGGWLSKKTMAATQLLVSFCDAIIFGKKTFKYSDL